MAREVLLVVLAGVFGPHSQQDAYYRNHRSGAGKKLTDISMSGVRWFEVLCSE